VHHRSSINQEGMFRFLGVQFVERSTLRRERNHPFHV